jgi:hypothetical protein
MARRKGGCRRFGRRSRERVAWRVRCPRPRQRACAPTDGSPPENCSTKPRTDVVGQPDHGCSIREVPCPRSSSAAGRRRSPATLPGFHAGRPPRNKGFRYPPDPPRVEEIVAVMRQAGETDHGLRVRALIVVLWRAGLRMGEAMALTEPDLDPGRGSVLIRQGKGGKRREVAWTSGASTSSVRGSPVGSGCRSARRSALSTARPVAVPGRPRLRATTCGASQPRLAYVAASRRTSSATRTRSRWHAKASS